MAKSGKKDYDWRPLFLEALKKCGVILYAAKAAGIHRKTAFYERRHNPEFKVEMAAAMDDAADVLEMECWRRAVHGVEKPVTVAGKAVTVREYSDTLLIFLCKAVRPEKFRERFEHHHTGEEYRVAGGTREERRKEVFDNLLKLASVRSEN